MKLMINSGIRWISGITLLCASALTFACSCPTGPLDRDAGGDAKHVFVFRLLDARLESDDGARGNFHGPAHGRIRVVESLRGGGKQFESIEFYTAQCCGSRLDIGHYYIAFVDADGKSFLANSSSVAELYFGYSEPTSDARSVILKAAGIRKRLDGSVVLDEAFLDRAFARISQMPPPPPPCSEGKSRTKDD